jgi:hypothetical protein
MIAYSITIAPLDFLSLLAEVIKMAAYLNNRLCHKHLLSSKILSEPFHSKTLTISKLKHFGIKSYVYTSKEEHSSRGKQLPYTIKVIILIDISSPKVY